MKTCGVFCPTILNDETPDSDTEKKNSVKLNVSLVLFLF